MLGRLTGAALALAMLLSGCGHGGSAYRTTSDIAAAIGCKDDSSPDVHPNDGYTLERCTYQGHRLAIYTFQKQKSSYNVGAEGVTSHVHGSGWDVWCSRAADCIKVQRTIGGSLIRDRPPSHG
jgi:hypothetical protein